MRLCIPISVLPLNHRVRLQLGPPVDDHAGGLTCAPTKKGSQDDLLRIGRERTQPSYEEAVLHLLQCGPQLLHQGIDLPSNRLPLLQNTPDQEGPLVLPGLRHLITLLAKPCLMSSSARVVQ
jgi:hypothetical protein